MSDATGPARTCWERRRSLAAVGSAVGLVLLFGCGPSEDPTALAVEHPQWVAAASEDGPSLRFDTECADVSKATVEAAGGVEGIPLVTVWGRPRMGRCRTEVVVTVPAGTARIEDAATGMVVDLPAP
ncbi:MAG: hypothetical protein ABI239_11635 [Aquihabitans sp.]